MYSMIRLTIASKRSRGMFDVNSGARRARGGQDRKRFAGVVVLDDPPPHRLEAPRGNVRCDLGARRARGGGPRGPGAGALQPPAALGDGAQRPPVGPVDVVVGV